MADKPKPFPGGVIGGGKSAPKAPKAEKSTAKSQPAKAPAKKAAAKAEKSATKSGIVRAPSTVSKEGTAKDAYDGQTYPVTQFPTVRTKQEDGTYTYVRGNVTRKNLKAYREDRKAARAAVKAQKEAEKAAKAKAKKAAPSDAE
jgi:hypothetical protein